MLCNPAFPPISVAARRLFSNHIRQSLLCGCFCSFEFSILPLLVFFFSFFPPLELSTTSKSIVLASCGSVSFVPLLRAYVFPIKVLLFGPRRCVLTSLTDQEKVPSSLEGTCPPPPFFLQRKMDSPTLELLLKTQPNNERNCSLLSCVRRVEVSPSSPLDRELDTFAHTMCSQGLQCPFFPAALPIRLTQALSFEDRLRHEFHPDPSRNIPKLPK